jgi:purine-nucleoside phosphorylase
LAVVLGSGLGAFADALADPVVIDYAELDGFPRPTIEGHSGQLLLGMHAGRGILVMSGRFHYYEGHSLEAVTFPVRVLRQLGVRYLLLSNSAGGINPDFEVGDLMVIRDHLNLIGSNPLWGPDEEAFGPRFPDMTAPYDPAIRKCMDDAAAARGLSLRRGVYAGLSGPSYETPAEIRMLRVLGADAVGMSTVPEVIVARHCGIRVAGISCISNKAAGMGDETLDHGHVADAARGASDDFVGLLQGTIEQMSANPEFDWSLLKPAGAS